ncbi:MAG: hypothetical protein U1D30_06895 [Planctomycetota bacterium]
MDPNQTWIEMIRAYHQKDWDQSDELALALIEWLQRGGFPPQISPHIMVGDERAVRQFVQSICQMVVTRFTPTSAWLRPTTESWRARKHLRGGP